MFALSDSLSLLILAGFTETLSVEVVESGPFTSVEQAMIPEIAGAGTTKAFATYNAVADDAGLTMGDTVIPVLCRGSGRAAAGIIAPSGS